MSLLQETLLLEEASFVLSFWWFELGIVLLSYCFHRHLVDGDVLLQGAQLQDAVLGVESARLYRPHDLEFPSSGSGVQFGQNSRTRLRLSGSLA